MHLLVHTTTIQKDDTSLNQFCSHRRNIENILQYILRKLPFALITLLIKTAAVAAIQAAVVVNITSKHTNDERLLDCTIGVYTSRTYNSIDHLKGIIVIHNTQCIV